METRIRSSQLALLSLLDMSVAFDIVEHNDCRAPLESMTGRSVGINGRTESLHLSREKTPPRRVTCGVTMVSHKSQCLLFPLSCAHKWRDKRTQENMERTHKTH